MSIAPEKIAPMCVTAIDMPRVENLNDRPDKPVQRQSFGLDEFVSHIDSSLTVRATLFVFALAAVICPLALMVNELDSVANVSLSRFASLVAGSLGLVLIARWNEIGETSN